MPELSYLSHVVFRLWEDTSYDTNAEGRYSVEVQVSPGTPFVPLETSDERAVKPRKSSWTKPKASPKNMIELVCVRVCASFGSTHACMLW